MWTRRVDRWPKPSVRNPVSKKDDTRERYKPLYGRVYGPRDGIVKPGPSSRPAEPRENARRCLEARARALREARTTRLRERASRCGSRRRRDSKERASRKKLGHHPTRHFQSVSMARALSSAPRLLRYGARASARTSIPALRFRGFTFVENVLRMKSSSLPALAPSDAPSRPAVMERAVTVTRTPDNMFSAVNTTPAPRS